MSVLFRGIKIGNLQLPNRVVMAPMQQRSGTAEAYATEHHIVHYSRCARGGLGLVIIESTAVAENGRLFQDDIGIFSDAHAEALRRVTDAIHKEGVPVFIQLSHGGRKSSPENRGRMLAPSPIAFDDVYGMPEAMTPDDVRETVQQFADAARRSVEAGFDGIELHGAHGYLMHQFLSPIANKRTDEYGGSPENRLRFWQEVLTAVRGVVGPDYPVIIRVSASDYTEGGLKPDEVGLALQRLEPLGLDAVHVSSGGILPVAPREVYPGYQVPFAETIKKYVSVPVIAVGLIHEQELAERVIAKGKADLIAVGRPLLEDANFVGKWKANR